MEEKLYEFWLEQVPGLSARRKRELQRTEGGAKRLYHLPKAGLKSIARMNEKEAECIIYSRNTFQLEREFERLCSMEIRFLTERDLDFPKKWKEIEASPYAVYLKGELPKDEIFSVSIVGARSCSNYGRLMAAAFAEAFAKEGVQIVSGMAAGVDTQAHKGALDAGGKTFAVLGNGVDICYPKENRELYRQICKHGGLLSEFLPGTAPLAWHFPVRNRLISALSDVVLVIEAKERSGSLITADFALEQGREVYALPGRVNDELSSGCNRLILQGAGIAVSPLDLMQELKIIQGQKLKYREKDNISLEIEENMLYSCLDLRAKRLEQIIEEAPLKQTEIMRLLVKLELKGVIEQTMPGWYAVKKVI